MGDNIHGYQEIKVLKWKIKEGKKLIKRLRTSITVKRGRNAIWQVWSLAQIQNSCGIKNHCRNVYVFD